MSATATPFANVIGADSILSGPREIRRTNPADAREVVSVGPELSSQDVLRAVRAARDAQPAWEALGAPARADVLYRAAATIERQLDELARLITREEGKPLPDASTEVRRAASTLRFYAGAVRLLAGKTLVSPDPEMHIYTERSAVGVVVLITPWNFPLAIPCQKMAPALAAGNAVVLKPSSVTPGVAATFVEILRRSGAPAGVVNLVTARGEAVAEALESDEAVDAISFTGSTEAGTNLHRRVARSGRRVQLEMGGKNPAVVLDDANLERALPELARGCFGLTGQSCTATGLVLAQNEVYDAVIEGLVERAQAFHAGDGLDPRTDLGPAATEREMESTLNYVRAAAEAGAVVESGGARLDDPGTTHGFFTSATVISNVVPDTPIATEEIFGPVAVVIPIQNLDEAIEIMGQSRSGLTAAIFTQSMRRARHFVRAVDVGIVKVNTATTGLEIHVPFGGFKDSGTSGFKELGMTALDYYSREKSVYEKAV